MKKIQKIKKFQYSFLFLVLFVGFFGFYFLGGYHPVTQASSGSQTYLDINRYSVTTNVTKGAEDVEVARVTLKNDSNKYIDISMPRFYAMADTSFDLGSNISAATMTYSASDGSDQTGPIQGEIGNNNDVSFNANLTVLPESTYVISLRADISSYAKVQAIAFDLDFNYPDFIISYSDSGTLAPFSLTGNNSIVCVAGPLGYCPFINIYTIDDYAEHDSFASQSIFYAPYIPEGGMIRDQFGIDVYIVKYANGKMFKRLILSPSVFNSYGHLKWGDIRTVNAKVIDSFSTSDYAFVAGNSTIWKLEPQGDTGLKRKFLAPSISPISSCNYDPDGVYEVNSVDRDSYILGTDITY